MSRMQEHNAVSVVSLSLLLFLTVLVTETEAVIDEEGIVANIFRAETICDVQERLQNGCSYMATVPEGTASRRECVALCAFNNTCNGASTDNQGRCFLHNECRPVYKCDSIDPDHVFMSKICQNGGVWNRAASRCECEGFWVGVRCQEYAKSCQELVGRVDSPGTHKAFLDIDQDSRTPLPVYCYLNPSSGYYNVLIMKNQGNSNFNLSWDAFRDGVYDDDDENDNNIDGMTPPLWVGLRQIHLITNQEPSLFFYLLLVVRVDGVGQMYQRYSRFRLSDEQDGFKIFFNHAGLTVDNALRVLGINFGTCLQGFQGVPFSTWDHDQDLSAPENCAALRGSGWWFKDCHNQCNLLGRRPQLMWDGGSGHPGLGNTHAQQQQQQYLSVPGFNLSSVSNRGLLVKMYMSPLG